MKTVDLIRKKRDGEKLESDEIRFLIDGYVNAKIPDYQMSALLMAIYFRGMDDEETANLTDAMAKSGTMLDLSRTGGFPVDKHSTGGVGDTTSLVLIPLLASYGLTVAKLSGRSLGHTGGTIDKLESIPGFRTDLSREEFLDLVQSTGLALANHTEDMVPADRLLYELRDVTSTVDSLPLIVSSIMSKKIAGGARAIVIDVKTGSGAFLKDLEQSRRLALALVGIGTKLGRRISALITDMSQPLGKMVGNALEVREAIETLRGDGPRDLEDLCCALGAELAIFSGKETNHKTALEDLRRLLHDGSALEKFRQMLKNQGADTKVIENLDLLPAAKKKVQIEASGSGWVKAVDAFSIGRAANLLGAGRFTKEDVIDQAVGIEVVRKIGDAVSKGQPLSILHVNDEANLELAKELVT
jgi:pyrimidine-nucleoside phosphorylase